MKRSKVWKRGKNFFAVGWGRYGPYASYTRRIRRKTYSKTSVGTKGVMTGLKYSGKRISAQVMHNLSTGNNSISVRRKRPRRRR